MFKRRWKVACVLAIAVVVASSPVSGSVGAMIQVQAQEQYSAWNAETVYTGGEKVVYNGYLYQAKWWTKGDNPEQPAIPDANPWQLLGEAEEGSTDPGTTGPGTTDPGTSVGEYPAWSAAKVYFGGEKVVYNGIAYEALWWNQDNTPGTDPVWKVLGPGTEAAGSGDEDQGGSTVVGESVVLTDEQIITKWGGINPAYSPQMAALRLAQYLNETDYEQLFPRRYGSTKWLESNPWWIGPNDVVEEYYSYDNLKEAITYIANIMYKVEYREGVTYAPRITVLNKTTKTETVISYHSTFDESWNQNKAIITKIVDFGCFLADGTENDKKREVAAFLANIAHETGGGWATAPDGELAWGLYFNEETGFIGNTAAVGYVDSGNTDFPAVPGKSYHGRGPIQLSWNYNYGLISAILYQDKNVLLNNPEIIVQDGSLGFMTALLFWMTPQAPKESCHDVMMSSWVPTPEAIAKGITEGGFGATINIINGGYEAGKDESDYRLNRRIGHYRDITSRNGADITGEKLNTLGMTAW